MVAAAQIRETGRKRESCACMMEVNEQAQHGKASLAEGSGEGCRPKGLQ